MNQEKWETIQKCARMKAVSTVPVALIVDSPWIPGYLGISTQDYFTKPDFWLEANLRVEQEFPEVIFLPGFWVELGMTAEPSGFGCRTRFFPDKTPLAYPLISSVDDVDRLVTPNPLTDGLMPSILALYKYLEPRVNDAGHLIKIVAARGPLAVASHLMGVTDLLLGLKLDPGNTHRLLKLVTTTVKQWLEAQAGVLRDVEAIMVLDDLVGFLSPKDYLEFAHPYLKEIFDAFPQAIKILHNDTNNPSSYPHLCELPVHIFNFTHLTDIGQARQLVGPSVCLMGNISPLDVLYQGSPELVFEKVKLCLEAHPERRGLIVSAGGGVSPGTPRENIRALISATQESGLALVP